MAHLYPSDYDGLPQPTTSTAVAIDKDKNSPYAVRWAIEHLLTANSNLILIHITSRSPDTGVNDSALDANGGIADSDLQQIFNPFRVYCARKRVTPKEVVIEDSDVSKALLSYINNNFIANVVLGAPTRNALARKFKNYDVPTLLNKHSPDFCSVYVIAKGKAVSIRPASRPAANSAMPPRLPSPRGFPLQEDIGQFNALYDACYPVLKTEWNVLKSVGDVSAKESNAGMLDGDCKGFLDQLFETNFKTNFRQLNAKILICVFWRLLGGFISTMPADVSLDDNRKWVCTLQDLFVFFAACQSNNVFQKHLHFLVTKCKISPVRFLSKLFTEEACGVCHSDLHVIKGELPFASPCVVGHEITGEVVEHGPLTDTKIIERFPVGAHVVGAFIIPCGSCFFCNKGQDDLCEDFFAYNRAKGTLYDGETRLFLRNSGKPVYMYSMGGLCLFLCRARTWFVHSTQHSAVLGCAVFLYICIAWVFWFTFFLFCVKWGREW